jgi:2-methylisocitrate lyase-like PEP mutase family enzyme
MTARSGCRELRERIEGDEILMTVGVYDGFNVKVVEHAGIRAGITGASPWSRWGNPDLLASCTTQAVGERVQERGSYSTPRVTIGLTRKGSEIE